MTYEQYAKSNGNGGRSTHDIQRDLGQIRGEIDQTLDALSAQLQPGQLLHQAWQSLRGGGGGRMLNNLSSTVQENPLPLAMIAAGFGYLMYSDSKRRQQPAATAPQGEQDDFDFEPIGIYSDGEAEGLDSAFTQGPEGLAERAKEKLRGLADGAGHAKENAKQKLGQSAAASRHRLQQSRQWAGGQMDRAEDQARAAKDWGANLIHEQPLVLAGLGLALGATFAALVPVSRKEHQVLGAAGESLRSKAGAVAEEAAEKATQLADKAKRAGASALQAGKPELGKLEAGEVQAGGGASRNQPVANPIPAGHLGASQHHEGGASNAASSPGRAMSSHSFESPGAPERHGATYAPNDPVSPGIRHTAADNGSGVRATEAGHRQPSVTLSYPSTPGSNPRQR